MRELIRKIPLPLVALLLLTASFGQPNTVDSTIAVLWRVADSITTTGDVAITFDTETATGDYEATIAGVHALEYSNNQTIIRRITVQANGTLPDGLTLTATAAADTGAGSGTSVVVTNSTSNLITGISSGTTGGTATVTFGAVATGPIDDTDIVIRYTITAGGGS
ncbi:MAG: hypothetical protein WD314_09895 [Trueperaceae bacterium]